MIIFLYGPDSYRREEKRKNFEQDSRVKYPGLAVGSFATGTEKDPSKNTGEELRAFIRNKPLWGGKQCAIFHIGAYGLLTTEDIIFLKEMRAPDDVRIIVTSDTAPAKSVLFLLEAPVVSQKFNGLAGDEYRQYVAYQAGLRGMRLTDIQIAWLYDMHGGDMWGVITELDMLALADFPDTAISHPRRADFMGMIRLVANGDARQKISSLARLMREHDAAKTFNILSAFVYGEKKRAMADYDIAMKRGLIDYELALTDFALG